MSTKIKYFLLGIAFIALMSFKDDMNDFLGIMETRPAKPKHTVLVISSKQVQRFLDKGYQVDKICSAGNRDYFKFYAVLVKY